MYTEESFDSGTEKYHGAGPDPALMDSMTRLSKAKVNSGALLLRHCLL
jgi:hypothetical protein